MEGPLILTLFDGAIEQVFPTMVVEYEFIKGYRASYSEPGVPDHVEIGRVYVRADGAINPLPEWQVEPLTEQLEDMCLKDWQSRHEGALSGAARFRMAAE